MPAVFRCVSSNNARPKVAARRKDKAMPSNQKQQTEAAPPPPDQVAYSQALKSGKGRDDAMRDAHEASAQLARGRRNAAAGSAFGRANRDDTAPPPPDAATYSRRLRAGDPPAVAMRAAHQEAESRAGAR